MRFMLLLALLVSASTQAQDSPDPAPPLTGDDVYLYFEKSQSRLHISGKVSSAGHETILRQTASDLFPNSDTAIEVNISAPLPPAWSLTSNLALRTLAHTQSATAIVTPGHIALRGFTGDANGWYEALGRLENYLPADTRLVSEVSPLSPRQSFESLCRQMFANAFRLRKIEFDQGNSELRSSAYALLDNLAELTNDCPKATISVLGRGDGGEASEEIGHARAVAVVDYLISRGVAESRLVAGWEPISGKRQVVFSVAFQDGDGGAIP